jgi:hypothetical protein
MKKVVALLAVFLLLILLVTAASRAYSAHQRQAHIKDTAVEFVDGMLANKPTVSYALFSSSAKMGTSYTDFAQTTTQIYSYFLNKRPIYLTTSFDQTSQYYYVTFRVHGLDGDYTFTVTISNQNKSWLVQSFTSLKSGS